MAMVMSDEGFAHIKKEKIGMFTVVKPSN